jgi:serine phosphatase RsbU (regulator of sigma subunit)
LILGALIQASIFFSIALPAAGAVIAIDESLAELPIGTDIEYVEDRGGSLDFRNVRAEGALRWVRSDKQNLGFGFTRSTYWLRFTVENVTGEEIRFLLEQAYPLTDEIDLYYPGPKKEYRRIATGDCVPFAHRPYEHRKFVFPLTLKARSSARYYMRVKSTSSMSLPLSLWNADTYRHLLLREDRLLMLFYGMMLIMIIYNLLVFFAVRHRSYIFYVLFIASFLLFIMTQQGTAFQFLWPGYPLWGNACVPIFLALVLFFGFYYTRSFLSACRDYPDTRMLVRVFIVVTGAGVAFSLIAFKHSLYQAAMAGTALIAAVGIAASVYIAFRLCMKGNRAAYFYGAGWAAFLAGSGLYIAKSFGIVPTNFATNWSILIGACLMIMVLSIAQADMINTMRRDLAVLSTGLEIKVKERTEELEAAMQEMEAINERLNDTNSSLEQAKRIADMDIRMASNLQASLLPRNMPAFPEWDIACSYLPMKGVSGDFYDVYQGGGRLQGLSLFDVSGHGISSGLLTILAKSILYRKFFQKPERRLNGVMESFNEDLLAEIKDVDNYLTGILLRMSGDTVEYVNAGHTDLLARRSNPGRAFRVKPNDRPFNKNLLGVAEIENRFDVLKFSVGAGDMLLLFSDGIVESKNSEREPYGEERLMQTFQEAPPGSAQAALDHVMNNVRVFTGGGSFQDDVTMILAMRTS